MSNKIVLYHATPKDYDKFDINFTRGQLGIHVGSLSQASDLAERFTNEGEENVYMLEVECEFKNPLRLEDFGGWESFQLVLDLNNKLGMKMSTSASDIQIRNELLKRGFDSVVYRNDFEGNGDEDSYISLNPNKQMNIVKKVPVPKAEKSIESFLSKKMIVSGTNLKFDF